MVAPIVDALRATFARRGTPMPGSTPLALTQEFVSDPVKGKQWRAFVTKAGLRSDSLEDVVGVLSALVQPPIDAIIGGLRFEAKWGPDLRRWT